MEKSDQTLKEHSEARHSNVFALAMTVGLIVLFVTVESPGGLSGIQGFFIGFSSVMLLFLLAAILEGYERPSL